MLTVFGSIILDHVFEVTAPPAPGETVLAKGLSQHPGGKGANQALAAAKAGADVALVGAVGAGGAADPALKNLQAAGVNLAHIAATDQPTGMAAISVAADGENAIMVGLGANAAARAAQVPDDLLGPGHILLVQMELDRTETEALIARAHQAGSTVILNLAPALPISDDAIKALDYLIVNEGELRTLQADGNAAALAARMSVNVITTLGPNGARLNTPDGTQHHQPSLAVVVEDTTGAGDAFSGAFAAALARGENVATCMRDGVIAGALTCTQMGAQSAQATLKDIELYREKLS